MLKTATVLICYVLFIKTSNACISADYRQFDFWLGEWQVTNTTNKQVSQSKISLINDGCGILEEYKTPGGYKGKSLNIFNQQTNMWHQTWVDNTGLLLQLNGSFKQNMMTMQGTTFDKQGNTILNKITWQMLTDGRVNQVWQTSKDQGKNWQIIFNGYYQKIVKAE